MRMSAWTMMPSVDTAARVFARVPIQAAAADGSVAFSGPQIAKMTSSPAIATTLFATGAHMYGPKFSRALRIWPNTVYRP